MGSSNDRDQASGIRDSAGEREREEGEERTMDPDSILSLLPTVSRMMRCLQPQIDAAARIAVEVTPACLHISSLFSSSFSFYESIMLLIQ